MTDTPNSPHPAAFAFEQAQLDAMRLNGQHFVYTKDTEIAAMLAICGYRLKSPKNDYVMETKAGKKCMPGHFMMTLSTSTFLPRIKRRR